MTPPPWPGHAVEPIHVPTPKLALVPPTVRPEAASLPRILCVDDEVFVLDALAERLRHRFEVVTATDGASGLRALTSQGPFAAVLADMRMPGMSGAVFLEHARQIAPQTVRLVLSGHSDASAAIAAINDGQVYRFLLKPCAPEELLAALEQAVEQHRLLSRDEDLINRKLAELSEQLVLAERRASLGTMAGAVAHELNNMLAVFACSLRMIEDRASENLPPENEDLAQLALVFSHMRHHASRLRELSRPRASPTTSLDLCTAVGDALRLLRSVDASSRAALSLELPPRRVRVKVEKVALEQVLINLVNNALHAAASVTGRAPRVSVSIEAQRGTDMAVLRVEDNGCGIPSEHLEAIFKPYYTTKGPELGTGLGLVVVREIVESAGGSISVSSHPGQGTVFTVTLPSVPLPSTEPLGPTSDRAAGEERGGSNA